jgi:hypothetical protein
MEHAKITTLSELYAISESVPVNFLCYQMNCIFAAFSLLLLCTAGGYICQHLLKGCSPIDAQSERLFAEIIYGIAVSHPYHYIFILPILVALPSSLKDFSIACCPGLPLSFPTGGGCNSSNIFGEFVHLT